MWRKVALLHYIYEGELVYCEVKKTLTSQNKKILKIRDELNVIQSGTLKHGKNNCKRNKGETAS